MSNEVREYIAFLKHMLLFLQMFPIEGMDSQKISDELKMLTREVQEYDDENEKDWAKYGDALNDNPF